MNSGPIRYRVRRECRAEHALPMPATMSDADALLHAARVALRAAGRSTSEARLDAREGELIVSYAVDPDQAEATERPRLGFV